MLTEERGVTRGKGGYADQWHHNVKDEHGNPKHPPGTKKHHEGRAEEHKMHSRKASFVEYGDHFPKEKKHIIAVADAHKKAAEAHEKALTLKGKQLHPDHPHVHAAMKATENVHKAEKAQKDYHNSSEYKSMDKKREAKKEQEHDRRNYAASISNHKRNLAHAKDPSIPRHEEAKAELADYHATRKALKDPKHPDHKWAKVKDSAHPYKYGDHLAKLKESLDADPQSMNNRQLNAIARNPNHPMSTHAKAELARRRVKKAELSVEGAMKRIVTTQSNKADRMASTDKKGLETYKKKVDEISLDQLKAKISNTGMKSTKKAMGADKIKKDLQAMKARLATEEKHIDEILDTPQAMQSYRDKNKRSKEKAANSAAAKILRGPDKDGNRADHSPELKTMAKRRTGDKLADRNAARKTFKLLRKQGQKK